MSAATMHARNLLFAVCLGACFTLACSGDDDDDMGAVGGESGEGGTAGTGGGGSAGKGGDAPGAGTSGTAGAPLGDGGQPNPGAGGMPIEPGGGGGGEAPESFVALVHDLIVDQTSDSGEPVAAEREFSEPQDERGHYLTASDAFDDLF